MDKAILKVCPAKFWHGDVAIIGNKAGLTKLKNAIETALLGELGDALVQETDGCEYLVYSKMHNGELLDEQWLKLPLHYDDDNHELTQEEENFLSKFLLSQKDSIEI